MKRGLTILIRQFGVVVVGLALLVLMSSISQITAAPLEQQPEPSSTPKPLAGETVIVIDGSSDVLRLPLIGPDKLGPPNSGPVVDNGDPLQLLATAGPWTGTTSRGYPMSFDVSSGGTQWSNFKLKTNFSAGSCSGTVETTVYGPATITNNQFSYSGSDFSFSGQFNSLTTASGSYTYNRLIPGCGTFVQSGTWTANSSISLRSIFLPMVLRSGGAGAPPAETPVLTPIPTNSATPILPSGTPTSTSTRAPTATSTKTPTSTPTRTKTPTATPIRTPTPDIAATAKAKVINNTGGSLTFTLSGPTSGSWVVANGQTYTVNVVPGSYQITAIARCGSRTDTFSVADGRIATYTYTCV